MDIKLFLKAITKYILGIVIVGVLLFIPANTFEYWNAWLFMGILFIPMFIAGIILMIKNPMLLKSRLDIKEKEREQRQVILYSGLMFFFGFLIAGLNYRFSWVLLPNIVVIIASILFIISYVLYAEVLRENTYLSRTIEVQKNQKVVDTGLYGIVRHPMYSITLILFLTMPLILGSIISKELKGYIDYKKKVKYRLIPFIW